MASFECCVEGCSESTAELHRFPADAARSREWREKLGVGFGDDALLVCGRHFSVEQYADSDQNKHLKKDATPDCLIPNIKQETDAIIPLNNNVEPLGSSVGVPCVDEYPTIEEVPVLPKLLTERIKEDTFDPPIVELENLDRMCRLCLESDEQGTYQSVFDTAGIVNYIQQSIGIEIDESDPYPHQICPICIERVNYIQRSREWFLKNDQLLRTLLEEPASSPSHDMIIPDLVPEHSSTGNTEAPEAIFFKEESALVEQYFEPAAEHQDAVDVSSDDEEEEDESDEEFVVTPGGRPKRRHAATIAAIRRTWQNQSKKKPAKNRRPTSFCTICSREFESPRDLRNHLFAAHQGVVCKHCGVAYAHPGTLELHIKKHHVVKEPLLEGKEQAVQNLFREMAEKFNGGVLLGNLGGSGAGGEAGASASNSAAAVSTRPKRQRTTTTTTPREK